MPTAPLTNAQQRLPSLLQSFYIPVLALGLGSFAIGIGEFVIMGLLPEISQDLFISIPQAGHSISAYAFGVVVGAPLLALAATRHSRPTMLIFLMGFYAIGHFASALAPSYFSLLLLRFASGLPHGAYFGIASLVAASLAPPNRRTRAVAYVMLGLSVATLFGVPLASALGQWFGWRYSFVLVGLLALVTCFCVALYVPKEAPQAGASIASELTVLRNKQVWLALSVGAIGFGGLFSIFSYVKPTLIELAGLTEAGVPIILSLLGAGMITGNLVGSKMADKDLLGTIKKCLVWSLLVCLAYIYTSSHLLLASLTIFCIGTVVAIGPAIQVRLMEVAGPAQTMAAALNHSAFNFANASGAFLGGLAIHWGFGFASTGAVGAVLSLGGLVMFFWMLINDKSSSCNKEKH